ncbi:MAG: ferritin-like domain-containing protein [Methyloceanibacter sp.]
MPKQVKVSENPRDMLKFDLDNENETIRNYRESIRQCEALEEFAMAEQIREILVQEQDHQIDLATGGGSRCQPSASAEGLMPQYKKQGGLVRSRLYLIYPRRKTRCKLLGCPARKVG